MVALLSAETVLLVLLLVLVAGLLRSHAEILRRLGPPEEDGRAADSRLPSTAVPPPRNGRPSEGAVAARIAGATPEGDALTLDFTGPAAAPTLLAFLTSGCSTCMSFWETLAERRLPAEVRIVIVTHGSERERPARLRSLAPAGVPVVMCSAAWEDYHVPGAPYFILVDGAICGEGVATTWQALASLVGDALEEQREHSPRSAGTRRGLRVDATLASGGIGPGHPSLYPGRANGGDSD
jgi:hypothetical protein